MNKHEACKVLNLMDWNKLTEDEHEAVLTIAAIANKLPPSEAEILDPEQLVLPQGKERLDLLNKLLKDLGSEKHPLYRERLTRMISDVILEAVGRAGDKESYWAEAECNALCMVVLFVATDKKTIESGKNNVIYISELLDKFAHGEETPNMITCIYAYPYAQNVFSLRDATQKTIFEELSQKLAQYIKEAR